MLFIAGKLQKWRIILTGPNGRINRLRVENLDGSLVDEMDGKFAGIAPPQTPHIVNFYEPTDGSRIHFHRASGCTFVSPPLSDSSDWLERSYASMFDPK